MNRQLRLNAFAMNCVGHQSQGFWRHPRDRSADYHSLRHWVELAQLLERGMFDGLFLADVLGVYDVYGDSPDAALRNAMQVPVNDPLLVIPSMAQATRHLGFAATVNLSHEPPLPFARRMSTLDHLTDGRIGWNIVTGYLDSGAKGAGQSGQVTHDVRYDIAEEFMQVQYRLWEGSWADDAVVRDRSSGVFTDPERVQRVRHHGQYFQVEGIHLCEPSPQRTPVLYQAGTSPKGMTFAARHAECVFLGGRSRPRTAADVAKLRSLAVDAGREPTDVLALSLATVITAASDHEAEERYHEYREYVSTEAALALMSGWTGMDFSRPELLGASGSTSNAIQSAAAAFTNATADEADIDRVAQAVGLGGGGPVLVGGPHTVADQLEEWAAECDLDGFNFAYVVMPETFVDIVDHLIPELQRRGLYKTEYEVGTLRHKLFGSGPRLTGRHPGVGFRQHATD